MGNPPLFVLDRFARPRAAWRVWLRAGSAIVLVLAVVFTPVVGAAPVGDAVPAVEVKTADYLATMKHFREALASTSFAAYPELPSWPAYLPSLGSLLAAPEEGRRWDVLGEIAAVAASPDCPADKRRVLADLLTGALSDPSLRVRQSVSRWLLRLDPAAFSPLARERVAARFRAGPDKDTILLVGKLGMTGDIAATIKAMVDAPVVETGAALYASPTWAALLASARAGDQRSIDRVVSAMTTEPNPVTQVSRLVHEIAYVHQPQVVRCLAGFLFSDERLPSSKPTAPGILYAQHAAEALGSMLQDFPIVQEYSRYSPEEVAICRNWMTQSEQWRFRE